MPAAAMPPRVRNDVAIIHRNGYANTNEPTTRAMNAPICPVDLDRETAARSGGSIVMSWLSVSTVTDTSFPFGTSRLVVHPEGASAEYERGEEKNDDQQDPGEGRGVAHPEELEGVPVEVEHVEQQGVGRSAAGLLCHDVRLGEGLHRRDEPGDDVEEDDRADLRERDVP